MLYQIKGKREGDQVTHWKEETPLQFTLQECLETKGCHRLRLNCPLFPLFAANGELLGNCAERLQFGLEIDKKAQELIYSGGKTNEC